MIRYCLGRLIFAWKKKKGGEALRDSFPNSQTTTPTDNSAVANHTGGDMRLLHRLYRNNYTDLKNLQALYHTHQSMYRFAR